MEDDITLVDKKYAFFRKHRDIFAAGLQAENEAFERRMKQAAEEYKKRGVAPEGIRLSDFTEEQFNEIVAERSARAAVRTAIRRAIEGNANGTMGELVDSAMDMLENTEYVNLGRRKFMEIAIDYCREREKDTCTT